MNLEILAVDLGEIVGLIVVVITILGSLINFLSNKNQPQAPRPQQRRPPQPPVNRGDKISNEIEVFLQEVTGRKPAPPVAERPAPPRPAPAPQVQVPQPRRVVTQQPMPTATPERKSLPPVQPAPSQHRPVTTLADRQAPGTQDLGGSVRAHLNEYMETRIEKQVANDLRDTVAANVQSHLGQFTASKEPKRATTSVAATIERRAEHPIVALLRNPAGVRQAIIIKEVLARPSATSRQRRK